MQLDQKFILLFAVVLSIFLLSACEYSLAQDMAPPPGSELSVETPTPEPLVFPSGSIDLFRGEAIFSRSCAPCHGFTGYGDGEQAGELPFEVPSIGDPELARTRTPLEWFSKISQGNMDRFMPPFSDSLSSEERWDVLAYVYRLSEVSQLDETAVEVYIETCADCHGNTGEGDGPGAADLAAPPPDFTDLESAAAKAQAEYFPLLAESPEDDVHSNISITQDQAWALTALVQSFAFGGESLAFVPPEEPLPTSESDLSHGLNFVGQVINGSGAEFPEGIEITLHAFDQLEEKFSQISRLDENGQFVFEAIPPEEELIYVASIDYAGLKYFSEILTAQDVEEDGLLHFSIIAYDSSTDISHLIVERISIVVEFPGENRVQIVQQVLISNDGDLAAAPGEDGEPVLEYDLPSEAENLTFEQGEFGDRYLIIEGGFGDLRAVLPGQNSYQILYAFDLPYSNALSFEQAIKLPTRDVVVFLPSGNVTLEGPDYSRLGDQVIEGVSYQAYRFEGELDAGGQINLELSGRHPLDQGILGSIALDRDFLMSFLFFAAATTFAWFWLRGRLPAYLGKESPNAIMDAIISLDASYESGDLSKNSHAKQRKKLKKKLERALEGGPKK